MTARALDSIPIPQQRKAVDLYIASLAAEIRQQSMPHASVGDATPIPDFVTGVRRKYLEALQTHVSARQALAEKTDHSNSQAAAAAAAAAAAPPDHGDAVILNRLNSSRQRQHQASLDTLSRHVAAFEKLLPSSHYPDVNDPHELGNAKVPTTSETDSLEASRSQSKDLLRKLEIAVYKERMQAEKIKVNIPPKDDDAPSTAIRHGLTNGSAVSRLRALRAVHAELTSWIEESLAACSQQQESPLGGVPPEAVDQPDPHPDDFSKESELEATYSRYVLERKCMVDAVDILYHPLPSIGGGGGALVYDQPGIKEDSVRTKAPVGADSATAVQIKVRSWQDMQRSKLMLEYARAELEKESAETTAMLNRLADESHLLPAYPRLVKAPSTQETAPDTAAAAVKTCMDAWSFASDAADVSVGSAIDRDLADGNKAIDTAMKTLRDHALLREFIFGS